MLRFKREFGGQASNTLFTEFPALFAASRGAELPTAEAAKVTLTLPAGYQLTCGRYKFL